MGGNNCLTREIHSDCDHSTVSVEERQLHFRWTDSQIALCNFAVPRLVSFPDYSRAN